MKMLLLPIVIGVIGTIISGFLLLDSLSPSISNTQKCYGSECKNPYLSNEIIGADFEGKFVKITLKNGTNITTDCLTKLYTFSQNETSWWCGNEVHTIQYVRNT